MTSKILYLRNEKDERKDKPKKNQTLYYMAFDELAMEFFT